MRRDRGDLEAVVLAHPAHLLAVAAAVGAAGRARARAAAAAAAARRRVAVERVLVVRVVIVVVPEPPPRLRRAMRRRVVALCRARAERRELLRQRALQQRRVAAKASIGASQMKLLKARRRTEAESKHEQGALRAHRDGSEAGCTGGARNSGHFSMVIQKRRSSVMNVSGGVRGLAADTSEFLSSRSHFFDPQSLSGLVDRALSPTSRPF